jgi:hypothetical protein
VSIPEQLIDRKADSPFASSLIHDLLRAEPTRYLHLPYPLILLLSTTLTVVYVVSRVGYEETIAILRHPFFQSYDTASVLQLTAVPPFIPGDPSEMEDEGGERGGGMGEARKAIYSSLSSDEMTQRLRYQPYQGKNSVFQDFGPMFD